MNKKDSSFSLFRKKLPFHGRMTRGSFWLLTSANIPIIIFIICLIEGDIQTDYLSSDLKGIVALAFFALLFFNLCIAFRRLHDTGRSGAYITIPMIVVGILASILADIPSNDSPVIWSGALICLTIASGAWFFGISMILLFFDSQMFENKYGPATKYKHLTAEFANPIYIIHESTLTAPPPPHANQLLTTEKTGTNLPPLEQSLHQAVAQGHLETVKLLLEQGADRNRRDHTGATALVIASQQGNIEIAKLLLNTEALIHSPS